MTQLEHIIAAATMTAGAFAFYLLALILIP